MSIPGTRPGTWPDVAPGRFARTIRRDAPGEARIGLLGLPDDHGVVLNGGRVGAAAGPSAFRAALAAYGTGHDLRSGRALEVAVFDAGDVVPASGSDEAALLETHRRVTRAARALHDEGLVPVCIGGGHDLTLPTVRALGEHVADREGRSRVRGEAGAPLGGISVDAHLDVRDRVGSGMPFRFLIEEGHLDAGRFEVFGAGRFVHAAEHVAWLRDRGAVMTGVEAARGDPSAVMRALDRAFGADATAPVGPGFVSIDLDALDGAYAPGVSAINPMGLGVGTVAGVAERAGRLPAVRHFDLMELSPPHDVDGRTARVAVLLFLHFLAGFSGRGT